MIGSYTLEAQIGRGGMAEVWRARHRTGSFLRAVKVLSVGDSTIRDRFVLEGQLEDELDHPNVVRLYDLLTDDRAALVLEYVNGPDLAQLLARRRLTLAEIDTIAVGVLRGLGAAHASGVVHRDLKPQNLLLKPGPCDEVIPKISDFGIAKCASDGPRLTRTGRAFGTPRYMAPEQLLDAGAVDARADVFSFGCVLYEMLTGRLPFRDGELYEPRMQRRFEPVRQHRPDAPDHLTRIVDRCLSPDPAERPADASELLAGWERSDPVSFAAAELEALRAAREQELNREPVSAHLGWEDLATPRLELDPARLAHLDNCARCRVMHDRAQKELLPGGTFEPEPPRLHHLPDGLPALVGREDELEAADGHLDAGARLVTLAGIGGAGKTRLALEIARRWVDRVEGEAWFCDLTEADDEETLGRTLARSLGGDLGAGQARPAGPDPVEVLRVLADRGPCLVVLDNCEQVVKVVAPRVRRWLAAAPNVALLVTSRERLRVRDERTLEVYPLRPEAARDLFVRVALASRPELDLERWREEVDAIVERLDGIPLAIELAAARVRTMTPGQVLARLDRHLLDMLAGGDRDRPTRQATLRDALDWSWALLEPWERAALAQAAVFHGGFVLEAGEVVLDLPAGAPLVCDVLQALADKSLLQVGGDDRRRWRMLATVREYCVEKLPADERAAVERRHLRWCAALDPAAEGAAFEIDNVVAATRLAIACDDELAATRLAMKLRRLCELGNPSGADAGRASGTRGRAGPDREAFSG